MCCGQEPRTVVSLCCEIKCVLIQEPGTAADERSAAAEASADGPGSRRALICLIYLYAGIRYFQGQCI